MTDDWRKARVTPDDPRIPSLRILMSNQYSRSRAASRAIQRTAKGGGPLSPEERARADAFVASFEPVVDWLIARTDVDLMVDVESPDVIYAWSLTSGPEVLHSAGVKKSMVEAGFASELLQDLLGDLSRHRICTLETPQFSTRQNRDALGDRPASWSLDPSWLPIRMAKK